MTFLSPLILIISSDLPYCCDRCAPHPIIHCCDICNPTYFIFPTNKLSHKPKHIKKLHMAKECIQGPAEKALCASPVDMCHTLAINLLRDGSFLLPQSLMTNSLVDHIVDLAHDCVLKTVDDLHQQITWVCLDTHGQVILDLFHCFCPLPFTPSASPFTTAPLAAAGNSNAAPAPAALKAQRKCKSCGKPGHYHMYICTTSCIKDKLILSHQRKPAYCILQMVATAQTRRTSSSYKGVSKQFIIIL